MKTSVNPRGLKKLFLLMVALLTATSGSMAGGTAPAADPTFENGHVGPVSAVAYSPDGKLLASGGEDGNIKLWAPDEGRMLWSERCGNRPYPSPVLDINFSPDGETVFIASEYTAVEIRETRTGKLLRTLHGAFADIVAVSPDGKLIATGGCDRAGYETNCKRGSVRLWNIESGRQVRALDRDFTHPSDLAFSPDGKYLAAAGGWDSWGYFFTNTIPERGIIKIWDVRSGALCWRRERHEKSSDWPNFIAFSRDGKLLLAGSGSDDVTAEIQSISRQGRKLELDPVQSVKQEAGELVAVSGDGKTVAVAGYDLLVLIDPVSGNTLPLESGHSKFIRALSFSPDGKTLVTGGEDHRIMLWDVGTGQLKKTFAPHAYPVSDLKFSPDGKLLASASRGRLHFWTPGAAEPDAWRLVRTVSAHDGSDYFLSDITEISFSPDGRIIATGSYDKTIKLWKVEDGGLIRVLDGHTNFVKCLAFHPGGRLLASGEFGQRILIWNVDTGAIVRELIIPRRGVDRLSFSPDGAFLAAAIGGGKILIWKLSGNTWEQTATLADNFFAVYGLAFSPDSSRLAVSDLNGRVIIFSTRDWRREKLLFKDKENTLDLAFSPSGLTLAGAGRDGTVREWRIEDGKLLRELPGHQGTVSSVAYSPDGRWIASGGQDARIRLWGETARIVFAP